MTRKKCRCSYCGLKYPVDNRVETEKPLKDYVKNTYTCPKCGRKTIKYS